MHDGARASRLHDQVVDAIGRKIITGELEPGALVVPDAVRAEYGVSASVVREAFRALQGKGLMHAKSKVGTKVSPRRSGTSSIPRSSIGGSRARTGTSR